MSDVNIVGAIVMRILDTINRLDVSYELLEINLDKILNSSRFSTAPKQQKLLKYLVHESYAGNGQKLKGYTVATEALGADVAFDSNVDSSVRVSIKRLRQHLSDYYREYGEDDELRFYLEVGHYEIIFLTKKEMASTSSFDHVVENSDRRKSEDRRKSQDRLNYKTSNETS